MPVYRRHSEPGQLQFITSSAHRRTKLLDGDHLRRDLVEVLGQLRQETRFLPIGWVWTPEPFHLPGKPALARTGREPQPPHARKKTLDKLCLT